MELESFVNYCIYGNERTTFKSGGDIFEISRKTTNNYSCFKGRPQEFEANRKTFFISFQLFNPSRRFQINPTIVYYV